MAKGTLAKQEITNKILNTFEGSFINGKEIRIPFNEPDGLCQIKVTLTAAKDNVDPNGNVEVGAVQTTNKTEEFAFAPSAPAAPTEITNEEKDRLKNLLANLGL